MKFMDLPAAQFGRLGEIAASRAFQCEGYSAMALFKSSEDSAPVLESSQDKIVAPDIALYKAGVGFAVEVKTHAIAPYNEWLKSNVHGIQVRKYDEYGKFSSTTGMAVYLGIVELSSGCLLLSARPLLELAKHPCQCGPCRGRATGRCRVRLGPEWYFKRDAFDVRVRLGTRIVEDLRARRESVMPTAERSSTCEKPRQISWLDADIAIPDTDRGGIHSYEIKNISSRRGRR